MRVNKIARRGVGVSILNSASELHDYAPPAVGGGGFKRYRDPSVCLSHGAAALGVQLP